MVSSRRTTEAATGTSGIPLNTRTELEVSLLAQFRDLPLPQQEVVVDFVAFLHTRAAHHVGEPADAPLQGRFSHFQVDLPPELIGDARRGMFANFPRDPDV